MLRSTRVAAQARSSKALVVEPLARVPEPSWCFIPAGVFSMGPPGDAAGPGDGERPLHRMALPAFAMSRRTVTAAQWRAFIDAGGYDTCGWWTARGWRARLAHDWRAPAGWGARALDPDGLMLPVTGISWYEAVAFCRWLTARLGYPVRLPSEAEWERVVRGVGAPDDGRGVHSRDGAPVGALSPGRHVTAGEGVEEPVGGLRVWTLSRWGPVPDQQPVFGRPYVSGGEREDLESGDARVVRGGTWQAPPVTAATACPGRERAEARLADLGVRLVVSAGD